MVLHISLKDLKVVFRDIKALAVLLLMPALIIFILGSALGSMFSGNLAIGKFSIGVVNKDDGLMSQVFINQVLRNSLSDMVDTYVVDEDKADEMLREKTVPAVVVIPEDFSNNMDNGNPVKIIVKSQLDSQLKASIISSVTEGFAQSISLGYAGASAAVGVFYKYGIPIEKPVEGMSDTTAVMVQLQDKLNSGMIEFLEETRERQKNLSAIQYYSAAMLVMFMLFGANQGTRLIVEEREMKTLGRIMMTRVRKTDLILGKFFGLVFVCLLQSLILIIFTRFVYGVDWGSSVSGIALVTLCAVFASVGFGMLIAAIAKTSKAADGMGMLFIQIFSLVGGGMIPYFVLPESIKSAARVTPNWWAVKGYHDLMLGAGFNTVLPYCGILIGISVLYLSVGIMRFRVE